jgi:hypothetical protein
MLKITQPKSPIFTRLTFPKLPPLNSQHPIRTLLLLLLLLSSTMPGHSRQDTALIHGLSGTEVDLLAESCVEAKAKAYCTFCLLVHVVTSR